MLAIPAKRADVVDLAKPLKAFFSKKFPADSAHFQNDITSFQQLRSAAVGVTDAMDTVGQQQLLRYNYHVSVMVLRLNDFELEMKLNFSWYDAYRPSRRFTSSDLYFDMAGVLWNMASFESTRAARSDRSTDEGVRQASRGFQQAAGILDHLHKNVVHKIKSGLSPDLTNESLEMAKGLMLAQAQACFYEKAVRDRKAGGALKPTVLSKLAFEAAALFTNALSYAKFGTMSTSLDESWALTLSYQIESFTAAAEYWQSMVAKEVAMQRATGYGAEIARLALAERHAAKAVALCHGQKHLTALATTADGLQSAIRKLKAEAESDNARIYLEQVPNPDSLPPLSGAKMVKMLDVPEYYNTEKPLFKDFTPSDIRAMVDSYRSQADALHRQQEEAVSTANSAARTALGQQGLPGSLEMYKSGGQLPENLWLKIEQIQQLGGVDEIQRKLKEVIANAATANATFEGISDTMQKENRADDSFRSKYPQYTASIVPYSDQLFGNEIKEPLAALRQACTVAAETNTAMQVEMNSDTFTTQAKVLSMSRSQLAEYLNSNPSGSSSSLLESVSVDTSSLEAALVALAALIEQRDEVLKSLRSSIDHTLVAPDELFMQRRKECPTESKDQAVASFVQQLHAKGDQLKSLCQEQDSMLSQISSLNDSFVQQRQCDSASSSRDANIRTMEASIAKFFEMHGKLASGESFYTNLLMRLSKLHRTCEDISFSQQLQRQEYEQNCMREHERQMQEKKDEDMAQQLSADFSRLAAPNQPPPAPTPFSSGPSASTPGAPYGTVYGQRIEAPAGHTAAPGAPQYDHNQAPAYGVASQYPDSAQPGNPPAGVPVYHGGQPYSGSPAQSVPHQSHPTHQGYRQPPAHPQGGASPYGANPYSTHPYGSSTQPSGATQVTAPRYSYPSSSGGASTPGSYNYGGAPYHSSSTPAAPAASPAQQYPPLAPSSTIDDGKVRRLTDMGFEQAAAQQALNMYNGNEEAAVNYLLGGGVGAGSTTGAAPAAAAPPAPASQSAAKKGWW